MNIIDQIKALLNQTVDNGCTEAEAANAAAVAQKLLTKHRINLVDLQDSVSEQPQYNFGYHFENDDFETGGKIASWKHTLFFTICRSNGCRGIVHSDFRPGKQRLVSDKRFIVIGTEQDSVLAKAFYIFLRDVVEDLAKKNQPSGLGRGQGKSWSTSFKTGCAYAIAARLLDTLEKEKETSNSTAIVRLDNQDKELDNWIKKNTNVTPLNRQAPSVLAEAYNKGKAVGNTVSLDNKALK